MSGVTVAKGDPRGIFYDLFPDDQAAELTMRAQILNALQKWIDAQEIRQADIGRVLGIPQPRNSEIKAGNFDRFSLDRLVQIAQRAGLKLELNITTYD